MGVKLLWLGNIDFPKTGSTMFHMLRRVRWWVNELHGGVVRGGVLEEVVLTERWWPHIGDILPPEPVLPGQYLRVQVDFIEPLPDSLGRKLYCSAAGQGVLGEDVDAWDELSAETREAWEGLAEGKWK